METLVEKYTSKELRTALEQRIKIEEKQAILKEDSDRQRMMKFLKGKKYLLETHLNPNCMNLYEIDTECEPFITDEIWVTVKMISQLYFTIDVEREYEDRYSDEVSIGSNLYYHYYDDFKEPSIRKEETKYKSFHPNNKLKEISKQDYNTIKKIWEQKEGIIKIGFKRFEL